MTAAEASGREWKIELQRPRVQSSELGLTAQRTWKSAVSRNGLRGQ